MTDILDHTSHKNCHIKIYTWGIDGVFQQLFLSKWHYSNTLAYVFLQYSISSIPAGVQNRFKTILLQLIFWAATDQKQ